MAKYKLRNKVTGEVYESDTLPVWTGVAWETSLGVFHDYSGDAYEVVREHARVVDIHTFFASFTAFEEVDIRDFAAGVGAPEDEAPQVTKARKAVGVMLSRLERAAHVNLDLPANVAGMQLLVSCGLITQARADEILAGPLIE